MHTPLLTFEVRRKRDAVLARRQARRVAAMLGFDPGEQACIAALVFELVCAALPPGGQLRLYFEVSPDHLLIFPVGGGGARVEKPLPRREPPVAAEDLAFVAREVARLAPERAFEEVRRQNQELLRVLVELRECQARLAQLTKPQAGPSAA
jgi:hypothetical protein